MARIWASAKQWQETMLWLRRVANLKAGLDPSRDSLFAELRGTREFAEITAAVREATPAISHSRPVFQVTEGDLVPEGVAYDPKGRYFYFGSMRKGKVVRCSSSGECSQFAGGLDTVLGLKVHGKKLWLLNNSGAASALICYDLAYGGMLRKYVAGGAGGSYGGFAKRLVWRPHLRPDAAG
jgi:hypothetical protein